MANSPDRRQHHLCWRLLPVLVLLVVFFPAALARAATLDVATLARRVDHHYDSLRSLEVHFVQIYQGMGMHRRQSGVLLLKKPGLMRWTYTNPNGKLYILNRKYGYFYTPGQTTAQRVPAKRINDIQSPLRYLLGHTRLRREIAHLHIASHQNGEYTLQGVPRHMEKQFSSLSLTVTPKGVIRRISIVGTDGVTNSFQFSGETGNIPIPASTFQFHPPPGVAIVDGTSPMQ